jgi:hypothetical protein
MAITLPTEGHYRPGRYMPVRIEGATSGESVKLVGNGVIPTEMPHADSADFNVPWLIASDFVTDAHWQIADGQGHPLQLHPLADNQRLVAFAAGSHEAAKLLFPNNPVVPVELDESRPLLEPVEAWECLDAVVLSASAAARVDEAKRAALLAGGTIIAVRSDSPPDDHWPWKLRGGYWILQYSPSGPQSLIEPEAYAPTFGWDRGWPGSFRRRVVFAAVLFCIVALATLLWRSRWAVAAVVALSLVFIAGLAAWYGRQSPVLQMASAIRVDAGPISQFDLWTWQSPVRPADASYPCAGLTHPHLGSLRQIDQTRIALICRPDGRPDRFDFHLDRGQCLAMCSRQIRTTSPLPGITSASHPLIDLANALYLGDVKGQYLSHPSGNAIPVLVIISRPR